MGHLDFDPADDCATAVILQLAVTFHDHPEQLRKWAHAALADEYPRTARPVTPGGIA